MKNRSNFLGILFLSGSILLSSCNTNKNSTTDSSVITPLNQNEVSPTMANDSMMQEGNSVTIKDSLQNNEANEKSDKDND